MARKHIVIIGGGTGGCAAAHEIARNCDARVTVLEAGPDYGAFDGLRWPSELLDTRRIPFSHDWGLRNRDADGRDYPLERARVLGGCSSHNGCCAVRGTREDFETWSRLTHDVWPLAGIEHEYAALERQFNVRTYADDEVSPYQHQVRAAALALGVPVSANINDLDEDEGVSICPVNKRGGVRWNAAFAFLDPLRNRDGFAIIDHAQIDDLVLRDGRVMAARGTRRGAAFEIEADVFVAACGAYGTPVLLQRSGIGDAQVLAAAGIAPQVPLPGVGRNLQDHPCMALHFAGSAGLIAEMRAHAAQRLLYEEGVIIKKRSSLARRSFDLHLFSSGAQRSNTDDWYWDLYVGVLDEHSRGSVLLDAGSGGRTHTIRHAHFSDSGGHDLRVMLDGVAFARALAAQIKDQIGAEIGLDHEPADAAAVANWIKTRHAHYWHPAGSCRMGTNPAAGDVCDGRGAVFGVGNLFVADAALMPTITHANTNLPAALLGSRVGRQVAREVAG